MNFSINSSISFGTNGGMVIRNGSQTIKMGRGGMIIENPNGHQIVMDNSGIHIYNGNSHLFVNSNFGNGNICIQTNSPTNNSDFENEEYSNSTSADSSYESSPVASREESHSNGFNYRINNNNMMWHSSQRFTLSDLSWNQSEYQSVPEPPRKRGLTQAQINKLPVNLYNGKAKKLKLAREKRSGKKPVECCENSSNDSCAICILDYTIGDKLKTLPCSHQYHKNCVDKWLKLRSNCPMCKFDLLG